MLDNDTLRNAMICSVYRRATPAWIHACIRTVPLSTVLPTSSRRMCRGCIHLSIHLSTSPDTWILAVGQGIGAPQNVTFWAPFLGPFWSPFSDPLFRGTNKKKRKSACGDMLGVRDRGYPASLRSLTLPLWIPPQKGSNYGV